MRTLIDSLLTAVSAYSGIPMPGILRNQKHLKYALCFGPVVGVVNGGLLYAWGRLCTACGFGQVCFALLGTVIPMAVTGGIHLGGLMRTADALRTCDTREKRLAVLQDPHAGTYGVAALAGYCLLYAAGLTQIWRKDHLLLLAFSFVISRALSGMSLVWFQAAHREGIWYTLSAAARRQTVRVALVLVLGVCFIGLILISPVIGALMALASMWVWNYYYYMSRRQFGGITGELAGYFICLSELSGVLLIGLLGRVL